MNAIIPDDIVKACGPTYFNRGEDYQRNGRVRIIDWAGADDTLFAEVRGSGAQLYQQRIKITPQKNGRQIFGTCSCPVRWNCKHVAAALIEFVRQPAPDQAEGPSTLQAWQAHLDGEIRSSAHQPPPRAHSDAGILLYVLKAKPGQYSTSFTVNLGKSRHLKRGGYGKLTPVSVHDAYDIPYWVGVRDRRLIKLIIETRKEIGGNCFEDRYGAILLDELIATGRCHLNDHETPHLCVGPRQDLRPSWNRQPGGETHLQLTLQDVSQDWICVPSTPPWYIDPDTHVAGPIETKLPGTVLSALRRLPPVAEEHLQAFSNYLFRTVSNRCLPPPIPPKIEVIRGNPIPVLTMLGEPSASGARVRFLRVEFQYGLFRLPRNANTDEASQIIQAKDGKDYCIHRASTEEKTRIGELPNFPWVHANVFGVGDSTHLDLTLENSHPDRLLNFWLDFLLIEAPKLETLGWTVRSDPSFDLNILHAEGWTPEVIVRKNGWFELGFDVQIEGKPRPLLPLIVEWLKQHAVSQLEENAPQHILLAAEPGKYLRVPTALLKPVLSTLVELCDRSPVDKNGRLKLNRHHASRLAFLHDQMDGAAADLSWRGGEAIREIGRKLHDFGGIQAVEPPRGLNAELRPYQARGLAWLVFLKRHGFGGILADDMGLGKTVQSLAFVLHEKEQGRLNKPVLIVTPTSVINNWRREAERFTPDLKALVIHGPSRHKAFERIDAHDLVLTTYPLLPRDKDQLRRFTFHSVILDEAQNIKNPRAQIAAVACALKAEHRLCLTGTPLENHLGELWSLFRFLMPGFLGEHERFARLFRTPIEKHRDPLRQRELMRRITPFMLRRTKRQVAAELPAKSEILQSVSLTEKQQVLYESIRAAMEKKIRDLLQNRGLARSHIDVLDALLKLRQVCCDPRLVKLDSAKSYNGSAKLDLLLEMIPEMLEEGRKILVFSQFSSMLELIEERLYTAGIAFSKLTGQTRNRDSAICAFQSGTVPVFLITLKAGGIGLNLTAADTVIHYDPWWNPATEQQATDRAYRIGQDKPVFVYKLITEGTVEERILALQQRKKELINGIYSENPGELTAMSADDVMALLKPL